MGRGRVEMDVPKTVLLAALASSCYLVFSCPCHLPLSTSRC